MAQFQSGKDMYNSYVDPNEDFVIHFGGVFNDTAVVRIPHKIYNDAVHFIANAPKGEWDAYRNVPMPYGTRYVTIEVPVEVLIRFAEFHYRSTHNNPSV